MSATPWNCFRPNNHVILGRAQEIGVNMAGKNFIKGAIKKPGQLHRDLGVPQGQKIPSSKLEAAEKRPGKIGERARFAETLKGIRSKR